MLAYVLEIPLNYYLFTPDSSLSVHSYWLFWAFWFWHGKQISYQCLLVFKYSCISYFAWDICKTLLCLSMCSVRSSSAFLLIAFWTIVWNLFIVIIFICSKLKDILKSSRSYRAVETQSSYKGVLTWLQILCGSESLHLHWECIVEIIVF